MIKGLLIFMMFALIAIIVLFVSFVMSTAKIIREQNRRLTKLNEDNSRLRQAVKTLKKAKGTEVINIYTGEAKEPVKFGGF